MKHIHPPGIAALGIVAWLSLPFWLVISCPEAMLCVASIGAGLIVLGIVAEVVQRKQR